MDLPRGVQDAQGDLDGARPLVECALDIYKARLGADHPTPPLASATSPASCTSRATWTAPGPLERALIIYEARLGPNYPDTVRSRERLAAVVAGLENRQ
jgi:hypothetical protein